MSKTKTPKVKLTEDQIIDLFCQSVNNAGITDSGQPKLTLFVGNAMFGKRFYADQKAARQAITKLAPAFTKSLQGLHPTATVAQVRKAMKKNPKLRKRAVDAAFSRELLYAQPIVRNPAPIRVALP